MGTTIGYNLGYEFLRMQDEVFTQVEKNIDVLVSSLSLLNDQNRDLQKLMAALTHAKANKEDADFTENDEMRETIDRICDFSPQIFGSFLHRDNMDQKYDPKIYAFKLDDIEGALTILDSTVKDQVSKINETAMYINHRFEIRVEYTESSQKIIDLVIRHTESIIGKTGL